MKAAVKEYLMNQMPGLDEATLGAIWEEYVSSAHRLWDELCAKAAAGDTDGADRSAHTLKGSAATVGDTELFDAVQGWRTAVKEGDAAKADAHWQKIGPLVEAIA